MTVFLFAAIWSLTWGSVVIALALRSFETNQ